MANIFGYWCYRNTHLLWKKNYLEHLWDILVICLKKKVTPEIFKFLQWSSHSGRTCRAKKGPREVHWSYQIWTELPVEEGIHSMSLQSVISRGWDSEKVSAWTLLEYYIGFVYRIDLPAVYCPSKMRYQPFQCIHLQKIHLVIYSTPLHINMHINPSSPASLWREACSCQCIQLSLKLTHAHVDPGLLSLCQPGHCWFQKVRHCDSHQSVDTRWHRTVETQHKS